VYPHYFRPRTVDLGRYFGVFDGDLLVAMIGERMGMPGYREISAVCTHPDFTGRGLARRLLAFLARDIAVRGDTPFLHVSPANQRAVRLYEQNGFSTRITIRFAALRAPAGARRG
jgi:predicted GNAT family acetyltransferase